MSLSCRLLDIIPIATGAGTKVINSNLSNEDYSHARELMIEIELTTIATVAATILVAKLQETTNGLTWNDRLCYPTILGNASASAAAPLVRRMALSQIRDVAAADSSYTPSGSSDGAALTAGQVINGPLPPPLRWTGVQGISKQPNLRLNLAVTDVAANGSFIGVARVYAVSEYER